MSKKGYENYTYPEQGQRYVYTELREQGWENRGKISAELIPGEYIEVAPDSPHHVGETTKVVDGLPRIGSEAEDKERGKTTKRKIIDALVRPNASDDTRVAAKNSAGDRAGQNAMNDEVYDRAKRHFKKRGKPAIIASRDADAMRRNFANNYFTDIKF